jgi:hypothetical protein
VTLDMEMRLVSARGIPATEGQTVDAVPRGKRRVVIPR